MKFAAADCNQKKLRVYRIARVRRAGEVGPPSQTLDEPAVPLHKNA